MLPLGFKVEKNKSSSFLQPGWFCFQENKGNGDLETTASVSFNDHNKMIRRKATLTLNNFPRTTLLNTFFKKKS